jgi:hypothetical protein
MTLSGSDGYCEAEDEWQRIGEVGCDSINGNNSQSWNA